MKRITQLLAFVLSLYALNAPLVAQTNACIVRREIAFSITHAPPGAYDCVALGSGDGATCSFNRCAPPNAAQETRPKCPSCGAPINLSSGNVDIKAGDLAVPGLGGGLALGRTWNSLWPASQSGPSETGMFGFHWRSNYEERIFVSNDNYIKYQRGDGSFWSFGYDTASSAYLTAAPSNDASKLTFNGTNLWTLTFQDGSKRTFDYNSGSLLTIADRNGNATTLTYDGTNRLTTVTDAAARHLYFTYGSSGAAFYLVQSITSDVTGVSLAYTYTGTNLTQVTKPDGTHITYVYNAQNLITAVKDNQGVVLESHTYDSLGRGLTSSRANGVQAVTVTYPQ